MAHEQGFNGGASRVQRGESTEDHGRGGEGGGVQIDAEELIDGGKTGRRALHRVVGRSEAVHVLVPRRRAGEEELDHNTSQVHVTKSSCKSGSGSGRAEQEHEARADEGGTEMGDAIRQPGEDIEDDGLVSREDVAQVCTVEDVLESGKNADPDRRSVLAIDEPVKVVLAEGKKKEGGRNGALERGKRKEEREKRKEERRQRADCRRQGELWRTGKRRRRRAMRRLARMAGRTGG